MPHRLYGHVDAAENYSVGRWCVDARAALAEAARAARVPILVGGTGLYFKALTAGLAAVPPIPAEIRAAVRARLARRGRGRAACRACAARSGCRRAAQCRATARASPARSKSCWRPAARWPTGTARACRRSSMPARAVKIFLAPDRAELYAPHRRALRRHAGGRRARGGARARGARARSAAAGHEGARRAVADPPSARRDHARGGGRKAASGTRGATPSGKSPGFAISSEMAPGWRRRRRSTRSCAPER